MANIEHKNILDPNIHEPKGVSTANAGDIYVANGTGSGEWTVPEPKGTVSANDGTIYMADGLGSGVWTPSSVVRPEVWDDVVGILTVAAAWGTRAPGLIVINDNGAGSAGVRAFGFDATLVEEVFFSVQLPHRYKAGTDLKPHLHWAPTTADAGAVTWGLEYSISNAGEPPGNTTIVTATDNAPGVALQQVITAFPTIPGTNIKESSIINVRLFRDAPAGTDTYPADAAGLSFDFHYLVEKAGSVVEYPGA
jgi:hypothetical protein